MTDGPIAKAQPNQRNAKKQRGWVTSICFRSLAVVLILALIEGFASLGMFGYDVLVYGRRPVAERSYTKYDDQLGWINAADTVAKDLYGSGRTVTINQQGFRATREFAKDIPAGKTRILCTGDSFTFGYGVGDSDTWCAQLEKRAPQFEVINMGQFKVAKGTNRIIVPVEEFPAGVYLLSLQNGSNSVGYKIIKQ